jgi:hypothetical protein
VTPFFIPDWILYGQERKAVNPARVMKRSGCDSPFHHRHWLRGIRIQTPKRSVATSLFRGRGLREYREIGSIMQTSTQQTPKQAYETPILEAHGTLNTIVGSIPCINTDMDGDCD